MAEQGRHDCAGSSEGPAFPTLSWGEGFTSYTTASQQVSWNSPANFMFVMHSSHASVDKAAPAPSVDKAAPDMVTWLTAHVANNRQ